MTSVVRGNGECDDASLHAPQAIHAALFAPACQWLPGLFCKWTLTTMDGMWLPAALLPSAQATPRLRRRIDPDLLALGQSAVVLLDFFAVAAAGVISAWLYCALFPQRAFDTALHGSFGREVLLQAGVCALLLRHAGGGQIDGGSSAGPNTRTVIRTAAALPMVLIGVGLATRSLHDLSRAWVLMWSATTLAFVILGRGALGQSAAAMQRRGQLRRRVAVVGAGALADRLIRHLGGDFAESIDLVGVFDDRRSRLAPQYRSPAGTLSDLVALASQDPIDWIIIALPEAGPARMSVLLRKLKSLSAQIAICPHDPEAVCHQRGESTLDVFAGVPLRVISRPPLRQWRRVIKAAEDRLLGLPLLLLLSPLMLAIAVAVRLDSPGPILFRQARLGWNNRQFQILKFRTMQWEGRQDTCVRQTQRGDTRVTRMGRILRATSLDELPQLINVLRGEMSLVGPRPHALAMLTQDRLGHQIMAEYAHRHRVKPGMTGWAQVNGLRGATSTIDQLRHRVEHDLYYIDNWSVVLDLQILLRTARLVLVDHDAF